LTIRKKKWRKKEAKKKEKIRKKETRRKNTEDNDGKCFRKDNRKLKRNRNEDVKKKTP
jgi:hypothetical protein